MTHFASFPPRFSRPWRRTTAQTKFYTQTRVVPCVGLGLGLMSIGGYHSEEVNWLCCATEHFSILAHYKCPFIMAARQLAGRRPLYFTEVCLNVSIIFFVSKSRRSLARSSPNFATCSVVTVIYKI